VTRVLGIILKKEQLQGEGLSTDMKAARNTPNV